MVQIRKEQITLLRAYWSSTVYTGSSGASSTNIAAATLNAASVTGTNGGDADDSNPVRGIVTTTPHNIVALRNADTSFSIIDSSERVIYGKITFGSGNYTITYYALSDSGVDGVAGTEVATTLPADVDIELLFPEVMQIEEVPVSASLTPWNGGGAGVGGNESLAETLVIGNLTHADADPPVPLIIGLNGSLTLKSGAVIESSGTVVTIDDDLNVSGSLTLQDEITGADWVTFTQQASTPGLNDTLWVNTSGDPYFRKGGVDYPLFSATETLAETLVAGNTTGGTEISVDNTDWIETGSSPATSGVLRLSASQQITSRNVANSGNRTLLYLNPSNEVQLGDTVAGAGTRIVTGSDLFFSDATYNPIITFGGNGGSGSAGDVIFASNVNPHLQQAAPGSGAGTDFLIESASGGTSGVGGNLSLLAGIKGSGGASDGAVTIGSVSHELLEFFPESSLMRFSKDIASSSSAFFCVEGSNTTGKSLSIFAADTTSSTANAGSLNLAGGSAGSSSGNGGDVQILAGSTNTGEGGDIRLLPGSANNVAGNGGRLIAALDGGVHMSLTSNDSSTIEGGLSMGGLRMIGDSYTGSPLVNADYPVHAFGFRGPTKGGGQWYDTSFGITWRGPVITPSAAFVDTSVPGGAWTGFLLTVDATTGYVMDEWGLVAISSEGTRTTIAPIETSGSTNGTMFS